MIHPLPKDLPCWPPTKNLWQAHANPRPYHFQSSIGKAITYKTSDGKDANAFELKAKKPTSNWLLVIHEW